MALTWFKIAAREWIPYVALVTHTDGHMGSHTAEGVDSTEAGARVLAVAVDTGKLR